MTIDQEVVIFDWFRLHFVENKGMAFGMTLGNILGDYAKLTLSIFRIVAIGFMAYILHHFIQKKVNTGLIISIAMILAGALGNMIDSTFYGLLFSESTHHQVATFLGEGYASLLHGEVVDMFYFPFYRGFLPDWIPFWGGEYAIFFRHIFNIADAAITLGVFNIILFQRSFFTDSNNNFN